MVAFAGGCLVGRLIAAACTAWAGEYASDLLILISIMAAFAAMIILVRKGITRQKTQQLFRAEEAETVEHDRAALCQVRIDDVVSKFNIGEREKEVLVLLLEGDSASEISRKLVIANGTAKSHIRHLYKKLGIHNRNELFEIFSLDAPMKHTD